MMAIQMGAKTGDNSDAKSAADEKNGANTKNTAKKEKECCQTLPARCVTFHSNICPIVTVNHSIVPLI